MLTMLLLETAPVTHTSDVSALVIVVIVGFAAAATMGSIAWYNSKRPLGWEGKERPDFVPEVDVPEVDQ